MEELISKKDLLECTNISYGQLYRWKRKQIIPEEWFIKKSVPSGQETFFPKNKILERIDLIVNMKDENSLNDLAKMVNSDLEVEELNVEKLLQTSLFSDESIRLYKQTMAKQEVKMIQEFIGIKLFKDEVLTNKITLEEGRLISHFIDAHYSNLGGEMARVYLLRNMGTPFVIGTKNYQDLLIDASYRIVLEWNIYKEVHAIKTEMK